MSKSASIEPLLPVELGPGKVKFAQGVKAGRWVFANGLMGQDFVNGIDPEVLSERMPHGGLAAPLSLPKVEPATVLAADLPLPPHSSQTTIAGREPCRLVEVRSADDYPMTRWP